MLKFISKSIETRTLPQALLFTAPRHVQIMQHVDRLIAMFICESSAAPCGECKNCQCLLHKTHPDIVYLTQEEAKIDNIRQLQRDIYQPAQFASKKFIIIAAADKLNVSVANALLKILEEPPKHIVFILLAEQNFSIPATISSRCQKYALNTHENLDVSYLELAKTYPEESMRAQLYTNKYKFQQDLELLSKEKITPCELAKNWSEYNWEDLLWFMYLLIADLIRADLIRNLSIKSKNKNIKLFNQLDIIKKYMRHAQQGIHINQTLALEVLLMELVTGICET